MSHSQWAHRNAVLHERDAQGLQQKEGQDLLEAIHDEFLLGTEGLHARDCHYITRGLDHILALPAASKKAWLCGIHLARETYQESEARELSGMRACMLNWLSQA